MTQTANEQPPNVWCASFQWNLNIYSTYLFIFQTSFIQFLIYFSLSTLYK